MWLLIDADRDHRTGWEGYDYIVNRVAPGERTARLERSAGAGGGWKWEPAGEAPFRVEGADLHLAIPRAMLGIAPGRPVRLDFKWADGVLATGEIVSWLDAGDCAPDGRFNYRFEEREPAAGK
jgi:hypothetical protein